MIKDENNLKDTKQNSFTDTASLPVPYNGGGILAGSYTKTSKLITALYMVTDIMDDREPLRQKLRTLGAEIVSDVYSLSITPSLHNSMQAISKISETMSFLDIASAINLVSQMNSNILKKEFINLKKSIEESTENSNMFGAQNSLSGFFQEEFSSAEIANQTNIQHKGQVEYKFPTPRTRLGVQKGSTLMKAISDKTSLMSNKNSTPKSVSSFDALKQDRRNEIISIIRDSLNNGATITDIKNKAKGVLVSVGEKTLQRELISMLKDNLLKKTGEKRWSRYFLSK
jgi:hypothetical protein